MLKSTIILTLLLFNIFQYAFCTTLPIEAFASLPDVDNMQISPDGKHIASLVRLETNDKKGTALSILDIANNAQSYPLYADNEKFVITSIHWANNKLLLIKANFPAVRYGTPTMESRLMQLDITTSKTKSVIPTSFIKRLKYTPQIQSTILDFLVDDDDYILMSINGFSDKGEPSVVKVSLNRDGRTHVVKNYEKNVWDWIVDSQHNARIGIYRKDTSYKILELTADENELKELWQFEAFSEEKVWPLGFGNDPQILFVKALHEGKDAIFSVNLKDPELKKTLIYFNENYDVGGSLRHSKITGKVVGIGSTYWDDSYQLLQKSIDKSIPETDNAILSLSSDEQNYITLATNDTEPGIYLLGDRKNNSLNAIAFRYEKLTPEVLSEKKKVHYKARDGLEIEGFLTLPRNSMSKNHPAIIFPHGGPISFDNDDFDYWTQFLASRGYAVFQMNFRGSHGYGFDFMKQGIGGWGQAMQDDVEDGTRWLIKEGIIDKNRVCILGASYGGYAALMGAVKTPELYQCAVSFAGVTNVKSLVKSSRAYINHEIAKKQIGSDYDELWEISPLKHADKIKIPVLLIHGTKDRSVDVSQGEDMYDKLKDLNKIVEYVELEDGDHYLSNNELRLKAFKSIEKFLAEYLIARPKE